MRKFQSWRRMARLGMAGAAVATLAGCQTVGSDYASIREMLIDSVSTARETQPVREIVLEPASLDPAAQLAPPVRRRPERPAPQGMGADAGGPLLERVEAEGAGCVLPTTPTQDCFTGRLETIVASSFAGIGAPAALSAPERGPATFLYQEEDLGAAYHGYEAEGAPVILAGDRVLSPPLERYLNDLLGLIMSEAPVPAPNMKVFLHRSTLYGAASTPGGDIFVSLGALHAAQSEDDLAALLAGEAAHLLLGHFDRAAFADAARRRAQTASGAALTAGLEGVSPFPSAAETELTAAIAVETALEADRTLLESDWERRAEDEADFLAVDLLVRAGYAPRAALDRLALIEAASRKHAQRAQNADAVLGAAPGEVEISFARVSGVFDALSEAAAPELGGLFRRVGRDPQTRFADLDNYMRREHDAAVGRTAGAGGLERAKTAAGFEQLMRDYQQAEVAADLLMRRQAEAAAEMLRPVLKGPIGGDPYPQVLMARTLAALGDGEGAVSSLDAVQGGAPVSPDGYVLKARLETRLGNPQAALRTLRRASGLYGPSLFLAPEITALTDIGDVEGAYSVYVECLDVAPPAMRAACSAAFDRGRGATEESAVADAAESAQEWGLGEVVQAGARKLESLF